MNRLLFFMEGAKPHGGVMMDITLSQESGNKWIARFEAQSSGVNVDSLLHWTTVKGASSQTAMASAVRYLKQEMSRFDLLVGDLDIVA